MSKLHDNADARRARGICALRALVIITRNTVQEFPAQPAIRYVATCSLMLVHWNRNGVRDLTNRSCASRTAL